MIGDQGVDGGWGVVRVIGYGVYWVGNSREFSGEFGNFKMKFCKNNK